MFYKSHLYAMLVKICLVSIMASAVWAESSNASFSEKNSQQYGSPGYNNYNPNNWNGYGGYYNNRYPYNYSPGKYGPYSNRGWGNYNGYYDGYNRYNTYNGYNRYNGYNGYSPFTGGTNWQYPRYGDGKYGAYNQDGYYHNYGDSTYPRYEFKYSVNNPQTGDQKYHQEQRDGDQVWGSYGLQEPDGSTREVRYEANDVSGFKAKVTKTGVGQHSY